MHSAFRQAVGGYRRAISELMYAIGSREIATVVGARVAERESRNAHGGLAHDVSITAGVGRHLGSQPRANVSMTIMRAPQRGHEQGSTLGASGETSGRCCGSASDGATSSNARAVAMLSTRLAEAKSP